MNTYLRDLMARAVIIIWIGSNQCLDIRYHNYVISRDYGFLVYCLDTDRLIATRTVRCTTCRFRCYWRLLTLQGHPGTLPITHMLAQVLRDTMERIPVNHKICSYSNFEHFLQLLGLRAARWGSCRDPINILSSGKEGARALLSIPLLSAIIGWWEMFHPSPWTV